MEPEKDYAYYWCLLCASTSEQTLEEAADKCLELAQKFSQINDLIMCHCSSPKKYWYAFIRLAENVRQIRNAVKFAPEGLRASAVEREKQMWAATGKEVPVANSFILVKN